MSSGSPALRLRPRFGEGPELIRYVMQCTLRADIALRCFDAHKHVHWLGSTARCALMDNGSASPLAIGGVNAGSRISFGADFPRDRTEHRSVCSPGYKSLKLFDSLPSTPSKLPAIEQVQRRRSAIQDFFSLLVAIALHFIKALTITFLQTSAIMISIGMSSHLMHQ